MSAPCIHHEVDMLLTCSLTSSVKFTNGELDLFYFSFHFLFYIYLFIFLFLEQLGLGLIGHTVTSVT